MHGLGSDFLGAEVGGKGGEKGETALMVTVWFKEPASVIEKLFYGSYTVFLASSRGFRYQLYANDAKSVAEMAKNAIRKLGASETTAASGWKNMGRF